MKPLTRSLVTLGVLGALGGGIAWYAYNSSSLDVVQGKKKAAQKRSQVFRFDYSDIEKIEINKLGNITLLSKRLEGWWVEKPVKVFASPSTVRTVLKNLASAVPVATYGVGDGPAAPLDSEVGLDAPDSSVRVWLKGGGEKPDAEVFIGDDSAFDGSVFTRIRMGTEEHVYGMPKSLRSIVLKSNAEFFDRRPLGGDTSEILILRIQPRVKTDAQVEFLLRRRQASADKTSYAAQKNPWEIVEPLTGDADANVVHGVLESLGAAPAQRFLTITKGDDLSQYGLDDPDWRVVALIIPPGYPAGQEPVKRVLKISAVRQGEKGLVVNVTRDDQPWVAETSAVLSSGLARAAEDLRSKRLFNFDVDQVARIEMALKEDIGHITLEKRTKANGRDIEWAILAPEPGVAMLHKVTQILLTWIHVVGTSREADLTGDAKKDAAALARTGLGDKAQTIKMLDSAGKTLGVVRIGKVDGDSLFISRDNGTFIIRVPKSKLAEVPGEVSQLTTR